MSTARLGIVNEQAFREAVEVVKTSEDVSLLRFLITILSEVWLRNALQHGVIGDVMPRASPTTKTNNTKSAMRVA